MFNKVTLIGRLGQKCGSQNHPKTKMNMSSSISSTRKAGRPKRETPRIAPNGTVSTHGATCPSSPRRSRRVSDFVRPKCSSTAREATPIEPSHDGSLDTKPAENLNQILPKSCLLTGAHRRRRQKRRRAIAAQKGSNHSGCSLDKKRNHVVKTHAHHMENHARGRQPSMGPSSRYVTKSSLVFNCPRADGIRSAPDTRIEVPYGYIVNLERSPAAPDALITTNAVFDSCDLDERQISSAVSTVLRTHRCSCWLCCRCGALSIRRFALSR